MASFSIFSYLFDKFDRVCFGDSARPDDDPIAGGGGDSGGGEGASDPATGPFSRSRNERAATKYLSQIAALHALVGTHAFGVEQAMQLLDATLALAHVRDAQRRPDDAISAYEDVLLMAESREILEARASRVPRYAGIGDKIDAARLRLAALIGEREKQRSAAAALEDAAAARRGSGEGLDGEHDSGGDEDPDADAEVGEEGVEDEAEDDEEKEGRRRRRRGRRGRGGAART